jgi:hypothetical protein
MNPPASFAFLITTANCLAAAVTTRDHLHLRPQTARKAVAARLVSGLRVLRAFLRRLIILMALELEWGLVDKRGEMKRPHGRKGVPTQSVSLTAFDAQGPSPWMNNDGPLFKTRVPQIYGGPVDIDMTRLYAQLDFLAKIAANPTAKARRLAFNLARTYEGIILAPIAPDRIAGRWGSEVRASFDAMAHAIITKSRSRPPPLRPLRKHWPTICVL